jgi:hypothetical protein
MLWKPLLPHLRVALDVLISMVLWSVSAGAQQAASSPVRSYGETIYIPAFSHVLTGEKQKQPMASTLVIHNVDPKLAIELIGVRYHDHEGRLVRAFVEGAVNIAPLATKSFLVGMRENRGGVGANFIVERRADQAALGPITEAVMIGGAGTQGLSFTSSGRVIARRLVQKE